MYKLEIITHESIDKHVKFIPIPTIGEVFETIQTCPYNWDEVIITNLNKEAQAFKTLLDISEDDKLEGRTYTCEELVKEIFCEIAKASAVK